MRERRAEGGGGGGEMGGTKNNTLGNQLLTYKSCRAKKWLMLGGIVRMKLLSARYREHLGCHRRYSE